MATNLADKEVKELIEICKELGLDSKDYITPKNKPRTKGVIIKAIEKFMKNKKPYKDEPTNKNIRNSMGDIRTSPNVEFQEINEIVWTLERNSDTNTNYKEIKEKLKNTITKCCKVLRDDKSVVGTKAQIDIMKILTIHILQPQFMNVESELYKRCKKFLGDEDVSQEKYEKYNKFMSYCCDINNIRNAKFPLTEWKNLVNNFLKDIFNDIYSQEESAFSFGNDDRTLMKLIEIVCELKIDTDFLDAFSTSFGDIHEAFREYSGGKGAKELGQFFTPRHLIHAVLHGCGLNEMIKEYDNPSIYDPCMGTGGLLTRGYSNGNILPNNIYGCETERDTIKFGQISILLETGEFNSNLQLCNSLCENIFVGTKKFDVIITNPPFGTNIEYNDIENKFNDNKDIKGINSGVNFKDVYPIDINNGTCLFVQHCIYMLEENGTCAIVVPNGSELYSTNKNLINYRKYICESVNILKIIKVESKTFDHTPIETAVIIFKKNGSTKNIEFMEIAESCDKVKVVSVININNIRNNNYNLTYSAYVNKEERQYKDDVVVKTLEEVCKILPKSKRPASYGKKTGDYPFYTSSKKTFITKYCDTYDYNEESLIIGDGGAANINYDTQFSASDHCYILQNKDKDILNLEYVYYYLHYNLEILKEFFRGLGLKNITKKNVENIKIPIPSLARQQEIVVECKHKTKEHKRKMEERIAEQNRELKILQESCKNVFYC